MALRRQVINLIGSDAVNQCHHISRIGHIAVVQGEIRMLIEPIDSMSVETTTSALDAVNLVALGQQQLSQIRSILTSDACD